ncbi:MAG: DNA-binding response regulator [Planctomycetota bacterium]|nr:MAG: DNA-binding response regulator [Planctomycetota bacterium]
MSLPRLLLADDHRIVVEGLRSILSPEFDLVGIVEDGRQLVEAARRLEPDIIIADVSMPHLNGLDAVQQLKREGSRAKVVFLTMHKDTTYAARAMEIGAMGFVLKHCASSELLEAIRTVLSGQAYLTPEVAEGLDRLASSKSTAARSPSLTPRQREIVQLFAEGKSAREVAATLHISNRTAENHKARIMDVLCLTSTSELIQYAIRHGIITPG